MNQYRVVYVEPGKPAVEKKIGTKLEDLQAEVPLPASSLPGRDSSNRKKFK